MKVLQDLEGYIWVATPNGLYRYDGQDFIVFRHQPDNPNSLISNSVFELELDKDGNILIGTGRGLSKYNKVSQSFTTFPKVLKDARVSSILPEPDGSLWVGTLHSGLFYFKSADTFGENPIHYEHKPNQKSSISSDQIHALTKDHTGNLWVGTIKGLNKMISTKTGFEFIHFETLSESVKLLYTDKKGGVWASLVGPRLINIRNPKDFNLPKQFDYKEYFLNISKSDADEHGGILCVYETKDNELLLGVHRFGLYILNPKTGGYRSYMVDPLNSVSISSNNIETIMIDKTNVLWVGTEEGGLNKCDLERKDILHFSKNELTKNSLSNSYINAIAKGNRNSIWVGTQHGLNKISFDKNGYENAKFNHYYLGNYLNTSDLVAEVPVWSILKDRENDFWLGSEDGVVHMVNDTIKNKVSFNLTDLKMYEVFSIIEDENGFIWFGSYLDGLVKWKKKTKTNSKDFDFSDKIHYLPNVNDKYSISGKGISCLYKDSKSNLWVGTLQGGLNLVIPGVNGERDKFMSYKHNPKNINSLSHNSVFSIHEDKSGNFWIGTFGGGLNKMTLPVYGNSEPIFKHFTEANGLANNVIYGILEDDNGKLWLSTDNGLSCFDPVDESFKNLDKDDGLQSNNFRVNAYFKNSDGYLFFGGIRGLNIFHPDKLKDNAILAEPMLTGFKIKNEIVRIGEAYNGRVLLSKSLAHSDFFVLKHHENTLTFEFSAFHYAASEKNKFKYQLEGFDQKWEDSKGLSFAHYTNLSPGNYTFKVKASNNDGVWNEIPKQVKFKIQPPFWYTWWAYSLYVLIISGVVFAFISYLRLQTKEKYAVRVQKEIEEVNKLKLEFFTNISHDFKTPITLILNPLEQIFESTKENFSLRPQLKVIERNANYLLRLVNQLMEFRKIEVGETKLEASNANIIGFVREITFSFKALAKKKNIELFFESQLYATDVWFDWDKLEKILNNLIFNAIKFSSSDGRVVVRINESIKDDINVTEEKQFSSGYIKIEVEDNGPGIAQEQLPFVFQRFYQVSKDKKASNSGSGIGLAIAKELVDLHHGTIAVDSKKGIGSRFVIKLPLGYNHLSPEEMVEHTIPIPITGAQLDEGFNLSEVEEITENNSVNAKNLVLVVDDNKDIRALVRNGLSSKYQIIEAENGKEALNIALKEIPDLIISDVLMPLMDGIEFCYQLKNNIRTSHIPVVLLTALNSVEHRIKGLESGADAYIPKPFKMRLLSVRVDKLIESRETMRKRFQTEEEITPAKVALNSIDRDFLEKIMGFMEKNMSNEAYWIDELASDMNTSRSTFFRKLKKLTGQRPNDFMRTLRIKRAAQLLDKKQFTVAEVSYKVGFNDPSYFAKWFKKTFGQAPSRYHSDKKDSIQN